MSFELMSLKIVLYSCRFALKCFCRQFDRCGPFLVTEWLKLQFLLKVGMVKHGVEWGHYWVSLMDWHRLFRYTGPYRLFSYIGTYRLFSYTISYRLFRYRIAYRLFSYRGPYRLFTYRIAYRLFSYTIPYRLLCYRIAYRLFRYTVPYRLTTNVQRLLRYMLVFVAISMTELCKFGA